ncbi:MAG: hypothetical protein ACLRT5_17915 [Lachnospiraceae bacterium]
MDYKKVLRLHFMNHLSDREIAERRGDCDRNNCQRVPEAVQRESGTLIPFTGRCHE